MGATRTAYSKRLVLLGAILRRAARTATNRTHERAYAAATLAANASAGATRSATSSRTSGESGRNISATAGAIRDRRECATRLELDFDVYGV